MKKKIIYIAFVSVVFFIEYSCKKTAAVSFTNGKMKSWFDKFCKSCHGSGGSNTGNWFYDPTDYTISIKNNISKLYNNVYINHTMPQGTTLSTSDLNDFKTWYDSGFPAN